MASIEEPKTVNEDDDDNILINYEMLKNNQPEIEQENKWDDPVILAQLEKEMDVLTQVRFSKNSFDEHLLSQALQDVFKTFGWSIDSDPQRSCEEFNKTLKLIMKTPTKGKEQKVPYSLVTKNKQTGIFDFWLLRSFVKIREDGKLTEYTDKNGKTVPKIKILMSRDFCNYIRNFCQLNFNDQAHVLIYTGSYKGKQHLDITRFGDTKLPDPDPNNLVMVQFKKKVVEEMIGAKE
jgi:DNA-directed RNA polymerase subunit H (RpoH/RPB5)